MYHIQHLKKLKTLLGCMTMNVLLAFMGIQQMLLICCLDKLLDPKNFSKRIRAVIR